LITLYGIENCDTVKRARRWLEQHHTDYSFHDFREDGMERSRVDDWLRELGWETLINRRGTTWRRLSAERREDMDNHRALEAILEQPALIKRPLLDTGSSLHVGFSDAQYRRLFLRHRL